MAKLINDEISAAWRALSGDDPTEGWRSIAVSAVAGGSVLAARNFPGNYEALLVGFATVTLPPPAALPAGTGFRVERVSTGRPGNWLALVRQPQGSLEMFARMVADVVAALGTREGSSEQRLFELFLGRIRAWQQFMSNSRGTLSPEAELGLAGELECLTLLTTAGLEPWVVMNAWKGPLDGLQDFELGIGALEVKSTLSPVGFPATILSMEQLDDAVRQPLFVCGCRFALGPAGRTLPERIAQLRQLLAADNATLAVFETNLLHAGFFDAHAELYTRSFITAGSRFFLVDSAFPRLTPATVPAGIRHARYEVDLEGVTSPRCDVNEVIEMIGAR